MTRPAVWSLSQRVGVGVASSRFPDRRYSTHGETAGRDRRHRDPARALFRHDPGTLARPNTPSPWRLPRDGGEVKLERRSSATCSRGPAWRPRGGKHPRGKAWMRGTSPRMTNEKFERGSVGAGRPGGVGEGKHPKGKTWIRETSPRMTNKKVECGSVGAGRLGGVGKGGSRKERRGCADGVRA
jgi:hypothetical protein